MECFKRIFYVMVDDTSDLIYAGTMFDVGIISVRKFSQAHYAKILGILKSNLLFPNLSCFRWNVLSSTFFVRYCVRSIIWIKIVGINPWSKENTRNLRYIETVARHTGYASTLKKLGSNFLQLLFYSYSSLNNTENRMSQISFIIYIEDLMGSFSLFHYA